MKTSPKQKSKNNTEGFTLLESLIVLGMIFMISGVIYFMFRNLFATNTFLGESLSNERDIQITVQTMTGELRGATQSSLGSYPLEIAASTSLAFYNNIDSNALVERVQYFLEGTTLKKSVVRPVGNPLSYATTTGAQESLTTILKGIAATTTPLFSYYDKFFSGTTTPLVQPLTIGDVRHIRLTITIDKSATDLIPPITGVGESTIRNLKDNY